MKFREPIERLIRDPKEFTRDVPFPDPAGIRIYDETLRDGEQILASATRRRRSSRSLALSRTSASTS